MEDMARLALVEQSVRDIDKFNNILYELLRHITSILENPHDYNLRTIKSENIKDVLKLKEVNDYLKYVGFETKEGTFIYPSKLTLSNLRMAQAAIERKISYCFGNVEKSRVILKTHSQPLIKSKLLPVNVLTTNNPFLLRIQKLFNKVLIYEDEELLALAREKIPIVTLQLMALDRVREQQAKIKKGEIKEQDLSFDIALLMELIVWFKHKFFSWVDTPNCEACGGPTTNTGVTYMTTETETCRVELYKCVSCGGGARFPRHNDVRALLCTRRGRCGEWANCFTLLARALHYDVRYVLDVTDHVWTEVYDFDSNSWIHVDPCEAKMNAPLMYSHGWGKKLSYVIAVSRDDLQDVTWRYTSNHKEVLSRRVQCTEADLISTIMSLRNARQQHVSAPRRAYLARRTVIELVQLMVERTAGAGECGGRISGASAWRSARGELRAHTHTLTGRGTHHIRYCTSLDKYVVHHEDKQTDTITSWIDGVYEVENVFRKVEHDWKQVYLAREEGCASGSVSWRVCVRGGRGRGGARVTLAQYCGGKVRWSLAYDGGPHTPAILTDNEIKFDRDFESVIIKAELSGGEGDTSWQHAQLFRQPLDEQTDTLHITIHIE